MMNVALFFGMIAAIFMVFVAASVAYVYEHLTPTVGIIAGVAILAIITIIIYVEG